MLFAALLITAAADGWCHIVFSNLSAGLCHSWHFPFQLLENVFTHQQKGMQERKGNVSDPAPSRRVAVFMDISLKLLCQENGQ